jgi:hypothetical protein
VNAPTRGESDVARDAEPRPANVTRRLGRLRESAQVAKRHAPSFVERDATRSMQLDFALEVITQLLGDFIVDLLTTQQSARERDESRDHSLEPERAPSRPRTRSTLAFL